MKTCCATLFSRTSRQPITRLPLNTCPSWLKGNFSSAVETKSLICFPRRVLKKPAYMYIGGAMSSSLRAAGDSVGLFRNYLWLGLIRHPILTFCIFLAALLFFFHSRCTLLHSPRPRCPLNAACSLMAASLSTQKGERKHTVGGGGHGCGRTCPPSGRNDCYHSAICALVATSPHQREVAMLRSTCSPPDTERATRGLNQKSS